MWKQTNIETHEESIYEILEDKNILSKDLKTISGRQINEYIQSIKNLKIKLEKLQENKEKNNVEIRELKNQINLMSKNQFKNTDNLTEKTNIVEDERVEFVDIDEKIVDSNGKETELYKY